MRYTFILLILISNFSWSQESEPAVQLIARSLPNKVMLRWAVDEPVAWKKANVYGFLVERATISKNGEAVVPITRQMLTSYPLKPKPLEEWASLANQDQNVAVLAQALYGKSFETTAPNSSTLGKISAVNDALEQRFTFALLAAEQNFEGSLLAGWGIVDNTVVAGEHYVYKVSVALPIESSFQIKEGSVYASPDFYEELPKPIGFTAIFGDGNAQLSWNFNLLSRHYTSYFVEKAEGNGAFKRLNGTPIFNASQTAKNKEATLFYSDSIPNNITYSYRVKGLTAFGEIGPPSAAISGKAIETLGFVPRIYKKEIPTDNQAILYWKFKEEGNALISKFQLHRSNKADGPFEMVVDNIPPTDRKITVSNLQRINYFTIVAVGNNDIKSESFSTIVQPVDSIPPAPPVEITGVMDTTGIVQLRWAKNTEEDINGYRIFRANNPSVEFSEITKETFKGEHYIDTVKIGGLNKKLYYKIQAEDLRYNRSKDSKISVVTIPDLVAPSPPVIKNYEVTPEGIRIQWIPSSSTDIVSHSVFRKDSNQKEHAWEQIFESKSEQDTTFVDTKNLIANTYSYTVIATDSVGLESAPSNPVTLIWKANKVAQNDIKFSGTVNRELRFINLTWKVKDITVLEYRLYRGIDSNGLKLYKTFDGNTHGYNDVGLKINSQYTYGLQLILNEGITSGIKKINLKY